MKWLTSSALATILLASTVMGADGPKETPYYPMQIGNTWTYKANSGEKFVIKVKSYEKKKGDNTARIEMMKDDKVAAYENVGVKDDGIYRYSFGDKEPDKPVRFVKLPPVKGEEWKVDVSAAGESLKGTFKMGEEEVKVPAGTYKCITSTSDDLDVAGLKISCTFYFAKDVGLVKQILKVSGQEIVMELEKFEAGKK